VIPSSKLTRNVLSKCRFGHLKSVTFTNPTSVSIAAVGIPPTNEPLLSAVSCQSEVIIAQAVDLYLYLVPEISLVWNYR